LYESGYLVDGGFAGVEVVLYNDLKQEHFVGVVGERGLELGTAGSQERYNLSFYSAEAARALIIMGL
jgi:hypothetical protein